MDAQDVADYALVTCNSEAAIAEHFDIDEEDVAELLLDATVERCPGCDWWHEAGELVDDNGDLVGCDQCREKDASWFGSPSLADAPVVSQPTSMSKLPLKSSLTLTIRPTTH